MKEFALKHPILTFLLADSAIAGICNLIKFGLAAFGKNQVVEVEKGANVNESSGDNQ